FQEIRNNIEKTVNQTECPVSNITLLIDEENKIIANYKYNASQVDLGEPLKRDNEILLDTLYAKDNNISVGNKVTLLNREFTVAGLTLSPGKDIAFNEVTYNALTDSDGIYRIDVRLKQPPNKKTSERFLGFLSQNFSGGSVMPPGERNFSSEYGFDSQLLISFSVMLLIIFNISFIYQYILMKRKDKFVIYNICGCTKTKSFLILFSEIMSYFGLHLVLALAIWFGFLKSLLIGKEIAFGFLDVAIPILVYLGFMLIVFVPKIIKYSRQTTIKLLYSEKK
ncbi:MAG: FtsX-like permease family protein, partial [Oscillospiraceae bacterium]